MYCKYCGSRLKFDLNVCNVCGAKINIADGGQSFFEDEDLQEWAVDASMFSAPSDIPHTEIKFAEYIEDTDKSNVKKTKKTENQPMEVQNPKAFPPTVSETFFNENEDKFKDDDDTSGISKTVDLDNIGMTAKNNATEEQGNNLISDYYSSTKRGGRKRYKAKSTSGKFGISQSNKVIAIYATVALVVVIIIAAFAAVINSLKQGDTNEGSDVQTTEAVQTTDDVQTAEGGQTAVQATDDAKSKDDTKSKDNAKSKDNTKSKDNAKEDNILLNKEATNPKYIMDLDKKRYKEQDEWEILDKDGKDVTISAPKYIIDGTLYVSADYLLSYYGYTSDDDDENSLKIVFTNKDSGKEITLIMGSCYVTVADNGKEKEKQLDYCVYNDKPLGNTYVPIKSFCDVLGIKSDVDMNKHCFRLKEDL